MKESTRQGEVNSISKISLGDGVDMDRGAAKSDRR
jgi:hypothetical protein